MYAKLICSTIYHAQGALLLSLAVTVPLDSLMWGKLIWPVRFSTWRAGRSLTHALGIRARRSWMCCGSTWLTTAVESGALHPGTGACCCSNGVATVLLTRMPPVFDNCAQVLYIRASARAARRCTARSSWRTSGAPRVAASVRGAFLRHLVLQAAAQGVCDR